MTILLKILNKFSSQTRGELLRFLLSGVGTMLLCLFSIWIMVSYVGLNRFVSLNLSVAIGYLYAYFINRSFVFRKVERNHLFYGSRFFVLQAILLALNNGIFYVGVSLLGWHYIVVNFVIAVLLTILNFVCMKKSVFV